MDINEDKEKSSTYQNHDQKDTSGIAENKLQFDKNALRERLLEDSVRENKELLERLSRT